MKEDLRIKVAAARDSLGALVDCHVEGVPWEYGAQVKKLRRDLADLDFALTTFPPLDPEAEWEQARGIFRAMGDAVTRLRTGPIVKAKVAAAAEELAPLLRELEAEVERLAPAWYLEERDGPDGSWPAGENPTHDDLDLGRKD